MMTGSRRQPGHALIERTSLVVTPTSICSCFQLKTSETPVLRTCPSPKICLEGLGTVVEDNQTCLAFD